MTELQWHRKCQCRQMQGFTGLLDSCSRIFFSSRQGSTLRNESLGIDELKGLAKTLGFTKIQRKVEGAPVVPLTEWNGFRPDGVSAYSFVGVLYSLRANTVAAHKPGEPDIYYDLF